MAQITPDGRNALVELGDTLPSIAKQMNLNDGGKAIREANQAKIGDNPMVLAPGWILALPQPTGKEEGAPTSQVTKYMVPNTTLNLRLKLLDAEGKALDDKLKLAYRLTIGDRTWSDDLKKQDDGVIAESIPMDATDGLLSLVWTNEEKQIGAADIRLHIGQLEPLVDPRGLRGYLPGRAVQKILINQGLYSGDPDGSLDGAATRAALRAFQKGKGQALPHGRADAETCAQLVKAQGNKMPEPPALEAGASDPSQDPLHTRGDSAEAPSPKVQIQSYYLEPTATDQTKGADLLPTPLLPADAYVAPSQPGEEDDNPNVIQASNGAYLLLDVGRWQDDARDFGVIWGRHAYLCKYKGDGLTFDPTPANGSASSGRLDDLFFQAMGDRVEVVTYGAAYWAADEEFDWSLLHVVIGDTHLMTRKNRGIWVNDSDYNMRAEFALLEFAARLVRIEGLQQHLKVVQIGDSYDLWVDCGFGGDSDEPLFETDLEQRRLTLKQGDFTRDQVTKNARGWLCAFIAAIQSVDNLPDTLPILKDAASRDHFDALWQNLGLIGPLNPAELAFRLLNDRLTADVGGRQSGANMIYIYGNHDDYLIDDALCAQADIPLRRGYYQGKGFFIEHAHRMEATFEMKSPAKVEPYSVPVKGEGPRNFDGCDSGFKATCGAFKQAQGSFAMKDWSGFTKEVADEWAKVHDHREYRREFTQVWLGRRLNLFPGSPGIGYPDAIEQPLKPPHLFVIGHTHIPKLWEVPIDPLHHHDLGDTLSDIGDALEMGATAIVGLVETGVKIVAEAVEKGVEAVGEGIADVAKKVADLF